MLANNCNNWVYLNLYPLLAFNYVRVRISWPARSWMTITCSFPTAEWAAVLALLESVAFDWSRIRIKSSYGDKSFFPLVWCSRKLFFVSELYTRFDTFFSRALLVVVEREKEKLSLPLGVVLRRPNKNTDTYRCWTTIGLGWKLNTVPQALTYWFLHDFIIFITTLWSVWCLLVAS